MRTQLFFLAALLALLATLPTSAKSCPPGYLTARRWTTTGYTTICLRVTECTPSGCVVVTPRPTPTPHPGNGR